MTLFVASFPLEDPNAAGSVLIESLNSAGQAVSARTVPVANRTLRLSWPWTENIRLTPTVGAYNYLPKTVTPTERNQVAHVGTFTRGTKVPAAPGTGGSANNGSQSAAAAGVNATSPRADVFPYLPKSVLIDKIAVTMTVWPGTSAQWATSLVALGENSRLSLVAQVPSNATEPLKVAEGTSQGDSYNPSAPRTDVPAGSEVVLSAGNTFLTAHFVTASQPVRIKQITGV